jgi:chitinase
LYARADEFDENQIVLNVHFAVKYWINKGTPRNKINLGLATYGRTYKLLSNLTELGSPALGPGNPGKVCSI